MSLFIGVDSGTQSVKAVVLDLDTRKVVAEARTPHRLIAGLPAGLPATAEDAGSVESAPMAGGPFVAVSGTTRATRREPRACDTAAERDPRGHSVAAGTHA